MEEYHRERKQRKKAERKVQQAEKNERKRREFDALSPAEQEAKRARAQQAVAERSAAAAAMQQRLTDAAKTGPHLVIDLDFWELMTEQERKSLVSQLAFCVGHNKRSEKPCGLHFTG